MIAHTSAAALAAALVHALAAPLVTPVAPEAAATASRVLRVATDAPARVTGLSLVASDEGATLLVGVDDAARVRDFTLSNPNRIIVDLVGTRLGLDLGAYDGATRGPVRDVRISQFAVDTVRIVVELSTKNRYELVREPGTLKLIVKGGDAQFARWDLGTAVVAPMTQLAADEPAETAPVDAPTPSLPAPSFPAPRTAPTLAQQTADLPPAVVAPTAASPVIREPVVRAEEAAGRLEEPVREAATPDVASATSSFAAADAPQTIALPLPVAPTAPVARVQPEQKPRITVTFDGTSIRDVIATFATFAGRTIVVGKDVEGTVTADIADKPWDVALQAILTSQGLAATEDASGIITVDSYRNLASNQALEPVVTQIININYAKATTLVPTVRALLARDCTGLNTLATGREMGVGMGAVGGAGGRGGVGGQATEGQGCVVRGQVAADSATNKLIITEVPSRLPEIVSRLQELDVRTPQVAIKAKIIFINRTGIQDIGLAYDLGQGTKQFFQQLVPRIDPNSLVPVDTDGDGVPDSRGGGTAFQGPARIALGGNAVAGIANANNAIKPNALNLIYSTALGRYQLTTFLNALQTSSLADVQSEPSVTILNNRTAEIFVGQEIPIRVIDASAGGVGGGGGAGGGGAGGAGQQPNAAAFFPRASVQIKEAGIRLSVTPQVTNNRMVLLDIRAENSNAEVGPSDVGVIFNQQRAESQVLVADGEAAVIGGLTVTEVSRFRSGIPFLMNLPFVGRLFAQNTSNETKRDLLILVTPHILDEGASIPPGR